MAKFFKDDLKISSNHNCMGVNAEFSKFLGGRKGKTVRLRFGDVIIYVIMSGFKSSQTSSLPVTNWQQQNTWLFLFDKLG